MRTRFAVLATLLVAACADPVDAPVAPAGRLTPSAAVDLVTSRLPRVGGVFTATNDAGANAVLAFDRAPDGTLTPAGSFPTGGAGIGGTTDPLFSQYSVALSGNHHYLYVVNAGTDDISVFRVGESPRLELVQRIASGGVRPVSLAVGTRALYALNAGSSTVTAFTIGSGSRLQPAPAWTRALSAGASGPAEVRLSRDGRLLAVTERVSATIDTYLVQPDGALGTAIPNASSGAAPFGFDYTNTGRLVVSEAGPGTASSYAAAGGVLHVRTASAATLQRAPCWLVVTPDGRVAFTANAGSATLTGFAVSPEGRLSLLVPSGVSADLGAGAAPLDLDVSADGRFVYVLKAGTGGIGALALAPDGSLTPLADTPATAPRSGQQGIAAF
ncbi:Lactonase, 7-bladed beta propeller [Gemmatirosa kalamazoonensis]|uniref:Lactonase, 7-bladed beta propeller n=1 Tax=Gemmatirosa kalamazoonensis TaxID=861299 RepID=W0RK01_9BACT|nr:beta-propeller fold lactonase family protein [Gemmatirosa kalamazoonensis]AHG91424.1 Lactonase, 7-bladed beta propeller [Gemmatirosa kalamazoonensis]